MGVIVMMMAMPVVMAIVWGVIVNGHRLVGEIHPQHKRWIDNASTDRQGASS